MNGNRLKGLLIILLIAASLLPFYMAYSWIERKVKPRWSLRRFFLWLFLELLLVGCFTFLVVLLLRLVFPGA